MLLYTAKFHSLLWQPEFLWWIFSWGAWCLPRALFWKRYFGGFTMHEDWSVENSHSFHGQPRETDPSVTEENCFPKERAWDQLGFPQQNARQKRASLYLARVLLAEGHVTLGTCPIPLWSPRKGRSGPQTSELAREPGSCSPASRPPPWLEDRHKATLCLGPDL